MSQQVVLNPWDLAMNPPTPVQVYWGQMTVAPRLVCLIKGVGKVDYDPNSLMPDGSEPRPVTAVKLSLEPLAEMKLQWVIEREPIAQGWGEWGDITLPSLRECGILELPALNGAWVKCELEPTGRTWTNAAGEIKEATAFKFIKVFASEAECRSDYEASNGNGGNSGNGNSKAAAKTRADQIINELGYDTAPNTEQNGNKERETALKFAKVFVQNACRGAGGDLEKAREALSPMLAKQPLISKFFTVDSPEIVELLAVELAK